MRDIDRMRIGARWARRRFADAMRARAGEPMHARIGGAWVETRGWATRDLPDAMRCLWARMAGATLEACDCEECVEAYPYLDGVGAALSMLAGRLRKQGFLPEEGANE